MRLVLVALLCACEGPAGPAGQDGTNGTNGSDGSDGDTGPTGDPGQPGVSPWVVGGDVDIAVQDLTFDGSGAHVAFTLKDKDGKPLDRTGTLTPNKVTVSFALAQLAANADGTAGQYTAYTKRTVTPNSNFPNGMTATQATTEGTEANFETVDVTKGQYLYNFSAALTGYDAAKTQSVLAVAARTVDGVQSFDRDVFHVGSLRRDEVNDTTCNQCHGSSLATHGGRYTKPEQCILCHTPQTTDPETNNTVDFKVMIHKIHRGEALPSYVATGQPYQIVGYGTPYTIHEWSELGFPGFTTNVSQNIQRCNACHVSTSDAWNTKPSKAACTSCHDTISFDAGAPAPMITHAGGTDPTLVNDSTCIVCHSSTSGVAPVPQKHYAGLILDPATPKVVVTPRTVTIASASDPLPGQLSVEFKVEVNDQPRDILATPLTSLRFLIAGPTTDISEFWQVTAQPAGATTGTITAVDPAAGIFKYTFPPTGTLASSPCSMSTVKHVCEMPSTATGSYQVGIEANWQPTGLPRGVALSPVLPFKVTDATAVPRRTIVDSTRCDSCHYDLSFHGGGRKNPNYCVMCHNPANANDERRPHPEGSSIYFAESVDFRVMIHKIHRGEELSQAYILGGNPSPSVANPMGTQQDFGTILYPRARTDCGACHTGTGTQATWTLPMNRSTNYRPSTTVEYTCTEPSTYDLSLPNGTENNLCAPQFWSFTTTNQIAPESSVCTSCHDAPYTAAHAVLNTTSTGVEACTTCHGPGKEFDVARFHGMP